MKKKGHPKKKKKLRLKVKVLGNILLFIAIIASLVYLTNNLKIKNIYITGTTNIKDITIIEKTEIKNYPKIYKLNIKKMKEQIKSIPLVEDVDISRNIFGSLKIKIKESKILFFYKYNNKYITNSNNSIESSSEYYGYPTLINFTPDTVFDELVKGLNKIDHNIIKLINEIEYTPYKSKDDNIIDNNLFALFMNDGNTVMIDTLNITNLNKYTTIFASLEMDKTKGIIYLDTIIDEGLLFKSYETIEKEQNENKKEEKESDKDN